MAVCPISLRGNIQILYCREEFLATEFIPTLFGESIEPDGMIHRLVALPIKQAGLALPDPQETSGSCHAVSEYVCSHLLSTF
jgi:hypothetical protein